VQREVNRIKHTGIQLVVLYGKSLSSLLICISLIPLQEKLKKINTGNEEHIIKTKISHVLYPNDLKLISDTEAELQTQQQTIKTFSDVIKKLQTYRL